MEEFKIEFKIDKAEIKWAKIGIVAMIVFLAIVLAWQFPSGEDVHDYTLILMLATTLVFGSILIYLWLRLKKIPFLDVAVDGDGIWYMHLGKDRGLVSWEEVYKVKESNVIGRLALMDRNNKEILRVDKQLMDYELLRDIINELSSTTNPELYASEFRKGLQVHADFVLTELFIFGLAVSGLIFMEIDGEVLLMYGVLLLIVAKHVYEYLGIPTGVKITNNGFLISYLFTKRYIPFVEISNIIVGEGRYSFSHHRPQVKILLKKEEESVGLERLGVDVNVLYKALRKAATL